MSLFDEHRHAVDGNTGKFVFYFIYGFSAYNQIKMYHLDIKILVLDHSGNVHDTVMPFGLKTAGATS